MTKRIWIKSPLAIHTDPPDNAQGGVVVDGDKITELLGHGELPSGEIDQIFDASEHVVLPGLINTCLLYTSDAAEE